MNWIIVFIPGANGAKNKKIFINFNDISQVTFVDGKIIAIDNIDITQEGVEIFPVSEEEANAFNDSIARLLGAK